MTGAAAADAALKTSIFSSLTKRITQPNALQKRCVANAEFASVALNRQSPIVKRTAFGAALPRPNADASFVDAAVSKLRSSAANYGTTFKMIVAPPKVTK